MENKKLLGKFLSEKMNAQSAHGRSTYKITSLCNVVISDGKLIKHRGNDKITAYELLESMLNQNRVLILSKGIAYFFIKEEQREYFEKVLEYYNWKKTQYVIFTELNQMEVANNYLLFIVLAFREFESLQEDLLKRSVLKLEK